MPNPLFLTFDIDKEGGLPGSGHSTAVLCQNLKSH
jgi:hypothetical protein